MTTSTRTLVLYGIFIALTFFLGCTPFGLIPLGTINVTILAIPTMIGTIVLGLRAGLLFGACFGLASFLSAWGITATTPSVLAAAMLAANPLYSLAMCMVPRLLIPVTTHFMYRLASKSGRKTISVAPAAIVGSLTNTIGYLGLMLLFFSIAGMKESEAVLVVITGQGAIAGLLEALAAALITPPVVSAINKSKT